MFNLFCTIYGVFQTFIVILNGLLNYANRNEQGHRHPKPSKNGRKVETHGLAAKASCL